MITFQAKYISSPRIQCVNNQKYTHKKVSFVELDPNSLKDNISIKKIATKWTETGIPGFAYDIYNDISQGVKNRFFAITTQKDDFENLDYQKILALAQVKKEDENEEFVEYLQVDPLNSYRSTKPEFSHVGTTMLNSLKKLFYNKDISLESVEYAIDFYIKNGFKRLGGDNFMLWKHSLH